MSDSFFEYVAACLFYDASKGELVWKRRPVTHFKTESAQKTWNTRFAGTVAGSSDGKGYQQITLKRKVHRLHRIVWLLCKGCLPDYEIDHINHDSADNRIENLRLVTHSDNGKNRRKHRYNTSGYTGVSWSTRNNGYEAYAWINDKRVYLGLHRDPVVAGQIAAKVRMANGYHINHGSAT